MASEASSVIQESEQTKKEQVVVDNKNTTNEEDMTVDNFVRFITQKKPSLEYLSEKINYYDLQHKFYSLNISAIYGKEDYNKLYKKLLPKLEHNYNRAFQIIKDINYIPAIIQERYNNVKNYEQVTGFDGRYQIFIEQTSGN